MEQVVVQQTRVGAYVVCVRDGSLLLVRFRRSDRWTLPGGGLDHGERPEDGAVREVEEETGLQIALGSVIGVDSTRWDRSSDGNPIDMHALRILYTAEVIGGSLRDEIDGSTDRAEWVPLAELADRPHIGLVDIGLAAAGHA
ncbi:NUDIX hydrolase [Pseudonocardia alaniniphila]|uniref:NUDIX domain-containing protein n=1 Tax=Pseudonocardia alaniniphila TaxID=75291 RepID=A0ABS9TMJ9_9PSEU|nr:NUDIX domain-containing protein [Pseudonocardia alaniniphila]MCH6169752.1 NUDIX domain-containing protein [Pseudonocardia alaniniphila]